MELSCIRDWLSLVEKERGWEILVSIEIRYKHNIFKIDGSCIILVGEVYNEESNTWSQLAGGIPAQVTVY